MRTRLFPAVALLLWTVTATAAPSAVAIDLSQRFKQIAQSSLSGPVAGISIAVSRNGQVVFAGGYGSANLEHAVPVTSETVFHIASISKNIEAAVMLQLVEQGKLRLDDDVTKYVPDAPTHWKHITIRQLLNHTSGIHSFTSLPAADQNESLDLTHDQVLALVKDAPLDFEPGTNWRYNNSGFYLAGMVIERVTGEEYGSYVQNKVFKPLGMLSSSLCYAHAVVRNRASGYEFEKGNAVNAPFISWKLPFAAGAICSTATDLVKWETALDGGRIISASSLAMKRTPTELADGTTIDYGLGTRLGAFAGHRVVGHTGSGGGFKTVMEFFPDDHLTVVVLTNSGSAPSARIAIAIAREALGVAVPSPAPVDESPAELAMIAGVYDSDEGTIELFARAGKLFFRPLGSNDDGVPMMRCREYCYAISPDVEVHFVRDHDRIIRATVYVGGLMMDSKYRIH